MSALEPHSYRSHWPLLIILALSAVLRLWQLNESLWLDELHTAWVVSDGPLDIFERARIGNHSPVYFFLPWLTTSSFGMSEWALRLPSLLAGLALVAVVYSITFMITRSLLGAITAALLASFDNNFLFYATEARPYACVQLVAVVQLASFWQLQSEATFHRRAAFILSTCLLIYLHYTAILLISGEIAAQFLWAWLRRNHERSRSDKGGHSGAVYTPLAFLSDLALVALAVSPGLIHLSEIARNRGNWETFVRDTDLTAVARWFSLVSYVVIAGLAAAVTRLFERRAPKPWQGTTRAGFALLLICWFAVPVVAAWIVTNWEVASLYFPRYLIGLAVAPMLLGGLFVGSIARPHWRLAAMVVVLAYACYASTTSLHLYHFGRMFSERREDWMSAVAWLHANYDEAANYDTAGFDAAPVFVRSGLLEADNLRSETTPVFKQYCLCPINSMYPFKNQDVLIPLPTLRPGALGGADINAIQNASSAWFVINAPVDSHEAVRQQVFASLKVAGLEVRLSPSYAFGNVRVWRVDVTE